MKQFDGAITLWTCVLTVLGSNLPSCELQYSALKKGATAVNLNPGLLFVMILPVHPTPHNLCSETAIVRKVTLDGIVLKPQLLATQTVQLLYIPQACALCCTIRIYVYHTYSACNSQIATMRGLRISQSVTLLESESSDT
jgi:hypothetical protein